MSIASEITRLQNAKAALKTAIESKGVTVPSSTTLDGYASLVSAIQTGGGSMSALLNGTVLSFSDSSLSKIRSGTFFGCTRLSVISFPNASTIGAYAFNGCSSLRAASFSLVSSIGSYAFSGCRRMSVASFPVATYVGEWGFYGCSSLSSISFPNLVSAGSSAFYSCKFSELNMPSLTSVEREMFRECTKLVTANLPLVERVSADGFASCSSLTTFSLPNATYLGGDAFRYCSKLQSVNLPNVTSTAAGVFQDCIALSTAIFQQTTIFSAMTFSNTALMSLYLLGSSLCSLSVTNAFNSSPISTSVGGVYGSIFVPASLYDTYRVSKNWSLFSSRFASLTETQIQNVIAYGTHTP